MTLHDSYLGSCSSSINRTNGWYLFNWDKCKSCPKRESCDPQFEALLDIPEDISDFIFEPGSSSGYVRFPPKPMIQNIVNRVRNNNGKVIANEVTTGIGRTGKWFGFQHYQIEPDMVAMGKGIGNGYPVSVAAINQTTMHELNMKPFKYTQSHQNDPLGAAIVKEVIQTIKDNDLISQAQKKGMTFLLKLQSLVDHKYILEVRGRGLMFAIDLADEQVGDEIFDELIGMGYIVCNRKSVFRIDPPLTITEKEFDDFIHALMSILASRKMRTLPAAQ